MNYILPSIEPVNVCKNRSSLLPLEGSRVHLTPKPGEDGSDYINATWLQGMHFTTPPRSPLACTKFAFSYVL